MTIRVVKVCACGAEYTAEQWRGLPCRGIQRGVDDVPDHELRDCRCGSTMSLPVGALAQPGMADRKKGICVDFDGVIHSYTSGWKGAEVIPDPPMPWAIRWLAEMVERYEISIMSTRAATPAGAWAIQEWLSARLAEEIGERRAALLGQGIAVVDFKPPAILYIDDRAWRFEGRFPTAEEIEAFEPWRPGQAEVSKDAQIADLKAEAARLRQERHAIAECSDRLLKPLACGHPQGAFDPEKEVCLWCADIADRDRLLKVGS